MLGSNRISVILFALSTLVHGVYTLYYTDLEDLGMTCPRRDKCDGYSINVSYTERNCECDIACNTYNDCCIDASPRRSHGVRNGPKNGRRCMHYGVEDDNRGVYVIATCSSSWSGPAELRRKCEGPINILDPLNAAPVVSSYQGIAYRNRYCAECNRANLQNLLSFEIKLTCEEDPPSEAQILADLTYNQGLRTWGMYRLNYSSNASDFIGCQIFFDVPSYLESRVRFCRSNIISTCPPTSRDSIRRDCDDYMAVVYDDVYAYKNPHCAICNNRTVAQLYCATGLYYRRTPMSLTLLLDMNPSDGDLVGQRRVPTPECRSGYIYDPFHKRCRQLVCALPGYVLVKNVCTKV